MFAKERDNIWIENGGGGAAKTAPAQKSAR